MIRIYTNEGGNWIKVYRGNSLLHEGPDISIMTLADIINSIGGEAEVVVCSDLVLNDCGEFLEGYNR